MTLVLRLRRDAGERRRRHDALVMARCVLKLPLADLQGCPVRRQDDNEHAAFGDECRDARLPFLPLFYGMAIDERLEAAVELESANDLGG